MEKLYIEAYNALRDKFELEYGVTFSNTTVSRKGSDLWEATIQTLDGSLSFKSEGSTQKEAVIDAFDKAKQSLDQTE